MKAVSMKLSNSHHPTGLLQFQEQSLNMLSGVLNIRKIVTYQIDEQNKPLCYQTQDMHSSMHREYMEQFYQFDPLYPERLKDNTEAVIKMNDLVSFSERTDHPYYADFINPWGIRDIIEIFLSVDEQRVVGFALMLNNQQSELSISDMNRVKELQKFMQYSLERAYDSPSQKQFDQFCHQYQLTPKEQQVLDLLSAGLPNKSIANNLSCSLATVKTHLQHIFAKTGVNSKTEVTSMLYRPH
jgi:DNA-binding CsgD family transcriptional regulator